ncbi:MAG: DnaJ family domain-containing protein [Desulfatibacillaceae bacterium]
MFAFQQIVEQRIREAQRKGEFENLEGGGQPLRFKDDNVPEELRLAYKILKNADCLPPEVELRKEIRRMEDILAGMPDTEERYRTMKRLNVLIFKLNCTRRGSIEFDVPEAYEQRLVERFSKKK